METKEPGLIYQKMISILKDTKAIGKDKENLQQKYKFRGIDAVYNELHDIFADNEVFISPEVIEWSRTERPSSGGGVLAFTTVKMKFTFIASDGSSVCCITLGEGMDSGDKSTNKGMSGAQKYALIQTFLIPTEDKKDSEHDSPEPKDPKVVLKEECLDLISKCKDIEDLKQLKEMYKDLFMKDKEIKDASKKKYDQISKPITH